METFTTQDLIQELQGYYKATSTRREGGITVHEWMAAQNISDRTARDQLNKMVEDGILTREWCYLKKSSCGWVYYKKL